MNAPNPTGPADPLATAKPRPIVEIAARLGLTADEIEPYGRFKAKLPLARIDLARATRSKLILVSAVTPTPSGEGKTTTSIGLADGLSRLGKRAVAVLREPSLGPVFGMKGGATGGREGPQPARGDRRQPPAQQEEHARSRPADHSMEARGRHERSLAAQDRDRPGRPG
jgi:Mrp family chromosome partitioning ATPase